MTKAKFDFDVVLMKFFKCSMDEKLKKLISGVGVVLVGACGPEEIVQLHETAAVMGFGGLIKMISNATVIHSF